MTRRGRKAYRSILLVCVLTVFSLRPFTCTTRTAYRSRILYNHASPQPFYSDSEASHPFPFLHIPFPSECHDMRNGSHNTRSMRKLSSGVLFEPLLTSTVFSQSSYLSDKEPQSTHSASTGPSSVSFIQTSRPLGRNPVTPSHKQMAEWNRR